MILPELLTELWAIHFFPQATRSLLLGIPGHHNTYTDRTSKQVFAKFWIIKADYDKIRKNTQKCTKKGFVQILQKRLKTAPRPFPHYSLCKSLSLTYFLKISSISHLSWSFPHCPLYQLFLPLHPTHLISNLKFFKRIRFNNWFAKCEKIEIWKKKWQHLFKFRYYQT